MSNDTLVNFGLYSKSQVPDLGGGEANDVLRLVQDLFCRRELLPALIQDLYVKHPKDHFKPEYLKRYNGAFKGVQVLGFF